MTPNPPTLESELLSGLYTDEEKAQILGQIEEAASANRLGTEVNAFRPRKRGILFPVMVNLVAVGLIAGAWWGAGAWYQTRQQGLQLKTDQLFSTESKLLAKVLEDSKNQLAAKNAEIEKIQGQMAQLAAEKADLQKSFTARVNDRERSLRQELAAALAAERQRLESTGLAAAEVNRRLREFEVQKNAEFSERLAAYRRQVQQEIDQRSQAVASLQARLEASVSEQEQLRRTVETQTKEREKELKTQLSTQAADLAELTRAQQDLEAFFRTVDPLTLEVKAAFQAQDLARTQTALLALRQALAKGSASSSPAVRTRAQAVVPLVEAFDDTLATLGTTVSKSGADAALEALRLESKKARDLVALELGETQKTLAASEANLRDAQAQIETLKTAVEVARGETDEARAERDRSVQASQDLATQVADLQKTVTDLSGYRTQAENLRALFTAPHATVRDRFATTLASPEALSLLPGVAPAWQELQELLRKEADAPSVRRRALDDVLTLTGYLKGASATAQADRDATEKLARSDDAFRRVVDDIQDLARAGVRETTIDPTRTQLYGTVASRAGQRVVLEPLTKVRPQVGDTIEVRHVEARKESVTGRGTVVAASDQKVEIEWTLDTLPRSGDPAYLVLP